MKMKVFLLVFALLFLPVVLAIDISVDKVSSKEVMINGQQVKVNARLVNIHGFSAHKDSDNLIKFVESTASTLKKIFIVLGEPKSAYYLGQKLHEVYQVPVVVPEKGDIVELD